MKKNTLVIGASENPERYAFLAVRRLLAHDHPVKAVGLRPGVIDGVKIETGQPLFSDIDTVTLYVGPRNQKNLYDYVLKLKPERVIFNPGTENPEFQELLEKNGIQTEEACTLVMLSIGAY